MLVLGISAYYHDSAAALVKDGVIIAAAAEERFNRIKHFNGFPSLAICYCLSCASVTIDEIDTVIFYEKPFLKFERIIRTHINYSPRSLKMFTSAIPVWLKEKLNMRKTISKEIRNKFGALPRKIAFCHHHLSHAALAYYTSGYKSCAILVVDAVGEEATTSIYKASNQGFELIKKQCFPHSLGLLYTAFTYFLGFKVNSDEYKVMGLAPYGDRTSDEYKRYKYIILNDIVKIREDGSIRLNDKLFSFMYTDRMVNDKEWKKIFGIPRRLSSSPIAQCHKNLALAIQDVSEEILHKMVNKARNITGEESVCVSGGCAMNCAAIGLIKSKMEAGMLYVPFAPGDDGAAIGCALFMSMTSLKPSIKNRNPYLGPGYDDSQIKTYLDAEDVEYQYVSDFSLLCERISSDISNGKIVGWFQGRMEFGPRALGNRSIFADPRNPQMKDIINSKVKFRESFRPFAPAVLEEYAKKVFDMNESSPYMMATYRVITESERFPAITHVDRTARVQTVSSNSNPLLYKLLTAFNNKTGCPLLLNTSFNVMGEPIVCSPSDAYRTFMESGIDVLVINNFIIRKQWDS